MEDRSKGVVEEITGRKVRAFLSQVALDPDISVDPLRSVEGERRTQQRHSVFFEDGRDRCSIR